LGFASFDLPDPAQVAAFEEAYLGISLTDPNAELIEKHMEELSVLDSLSLVDEKKKTEIVIPGVITDVAKRRTKKDANWHPDRAWASITVQWEGQEAKFAAFPDQYDEFSYMLKVNKLGKFTLETGPKGAKLKKGWVLL
jgi:DNA polymerase III alpha subunit